MSVFHNNVLSGAAGQAGGAAAVEGLIKSVRFNNGDSPYLNRTPSSASNRRTWTWAAWVKRGVIDASASRTLFSAGSGGFDVDLIVFYGHKLQVLSAISSINWNYVTTALFRDPSAWYHITVAVDTTNSTASDRVKIYVNGTRITEFDTSSAPSQNYENNINSTDQHAVSYDTGNIGYYFDGYIADLYLIDGQALDPTSFGAFDDNGVWQAAAYSGTFGTNGFHLFDFANESGIGNDSSGNDNDFTVNNLTALGPAATQFKVLGNASNSGSSSATNVSSLTTLQATNVSTYDIGGTNHNHLTADFGSAGTYAIQARTYLNIGTDILVFVSNNGSSWSSISNQQDPYIFTGRYIQWVRTGQGYDNQVLTAVDAGKETDVLFDVPTNGTQSDTGAGGEVSGNYATFNPLHKGGSMTMSNGNLVVNNTTVNLWRTQHPTIGGKTGKYYSEFTFTGSSITHVGIGIGPAKESLDGFAGAITGSFTWFLNNGFYTAGGYLDRTGDFNTGSTFSDVYSIAVDLDNSNVSFYRNGTLVGTKSMVNRLQDEVYHIFVTIYGGVTATANFGQRAFAYSAPSGYKALCTTNLPTPTIADGSDYFNTTLYTGNGSTQTISGLGFSPDFVWTKLRGPETDYGHRLADIVRGTGKVMYSNNSSAEVNETGISAFNSDGYTLGSAAGMNKSSSSFVSWAWDGGTSTASNTDGSITSSVRANPTAGFSIATFTTPSSGTFTFGHGLSAAPELILVKARNQSYTWTVYAKPIGNTKYLVLNTTAAEATGAVWNNTTPTSSVVSGNASNFGTSTDYVAYCFAPVAGYSAFGSYTGNFSSDGPFVYTGFRPAFILFKRITDGTEPWVIVDSARDPENAGFTEVLRPDQATAEFNNSTANMDILSNGFKQRGAGGMTNASGKEYIWAAFAQNPFSANGGLAR